MERLEQEMEQQKACVCERYRIGRTARGSCDNTPSKKGSRDRFREGSKKVLRRCLLVVLEGGRVLRRVLRRGSKKGLPRRHLEGRITPF